MSWTLFITALLAFFAGWVACSMGTWARLHAQESRLRALVVDIEVMEDLNEPVTSEWVVNRLTSMYAEER